MIKSDDGKQPFNGSWQAKGGEDLGVISYLASLGLAEIDLEKVTHLLHEINMLRPMEILPDPKPLPEFTKDEILRALLGEEMLVSSVLEEFSADTVHPINRSKLSDPGHNVHKGIRLYVVEEQPVLKEAYRSYFSTQPAFAMLGLSDETSEASIRAAITQHMPDVLLLGLKSVHSSIDKKLDVIRTLCPSTALVLLFAIFDTPGIKALREWSTDASAGYAYLLKHNTDTADQLGQIVHAVDQGRIIIDPEIMEELVDSAATESGVLTALSPNEMQVLSCMARGFANEAIASLLSRDRNAVERQVSSIYTKLRLGERSLDPRVGAALLYLRATGLLPKG